MRLEQIIERVDTSAGPDACHPYTGSRTSDGYGIAACEGRTWRVHRLIWTVTNGPIPDGLLICHTCDNRPCCNVAHLFLGTQSDNIRDAYAKHRMNGNGWNDDARKPRGRRPRGANSVRATLTEEQAEAIRSAPDERGLIMRFAREFGVSYTTVSRVRRGMRYAEDARESKRYRVAVSETRQGVALVTATSDPEARRLAREGRVAVEWAEPTLQVKEIKRA